MREKFDAAVKKNWCEYCHRTLAECGCVGMGKAESALRRLASERKRMDDSHYKQTSIEAIDVIEDWSLNFNLGNVVKYIARAGRKDGASREADLTKARWYIEREMKR